MSGGTISEVEHLAHDTGKRQAKVNKLTACCRCTVSEYVLPTPVYTSTLYFQNNKKVGKVEILIINRNSYHLDVDIDKVRHPPLWNQEHFNSGGKVFRPVTTSFGGSRME